MRPSRIVQSFLLLTAMTQLGCQDPALSASVARLKEACVAVEPGGCAKGGTEREVIEGAVTLLGQIQGLCRGLDTGSATCKARLEDLAGLTGQVGQLAGSWESVAGYGYKARTIDKFQVATAGTRYWIGARDNRGGIYVAQTNDNLLCGSTELLAGGSTPAELLDLSPTGTPGETREDLLCEKLYPGFPLALGTYVSMCVSTGWREEDHWSMNTKADEACIRSFNWRTSNEATREQFRQGLQTYVSGLAAQLDPCTIHPAPGKPGRMNVDCGQGDVPVFRDEVHRM